MDANMRVTLDSEAKIAILEPTKSLSKDDFLKEHHKHIKKLAFVTDSFVGEMSEKIGSHFVSAEVKNFDYDALEKAKEWIVS